MSYHTDYSVRYGIQLDIEYCPEIWDLMDYRHEYVSVFMNGSQASGDNQSWFLYFKKGYRSLGSSDSKETYAPMSFSDFYLYFKEEHFANFVGEKFYNDYYKALKFYDPRSCLEYYLADELRFLSSEVGLDHIKTKGIFDWHLVSSGG